MVGEVEAGSWLTPSIVLGGRSDEKENRRTERGLWRARCSAEARVVVGFAGRRTTTRQCWRKLQGGGQPDVWLPATVARGAGTWAPGERKMPGEALKKR